MTSSTKTAVKTTRMRIASLANTTSNKLLIQTIKESVKQSQGNKPVGVDVVVVYRNYKNKVPSYFDLYLVQEGIGAA